VTRRLSAAVFFALAATAAPPGYVDAHTCDTCHSRIAATYARTGMARSFGAVQQVPPGSFEHQPSAESFTTRTAKDKSYLRRTQLDDSLERPIDYWIGSGKHARSYLSRTPSNDLIELPLTWYSASGGHWGMSPGYDMPNHAGFSRRITEQCLFCHTAYPNAAAQPQGIDCQRCHGPGQAHVEAARNGQSVAAVRRAIVKSDTEVCLSCHLETTSLRLPAMIVRFDRGVFSYRPGEPLASYALYFDHAPGAGHDDKFEFNGAPYRLRKSACFLKSEGKLTCTTCHNPHGGPRTNYREVCRSCHSSAHDVGDCVGCHMPQRRPSDAIQVMVTDHYIRKRPDPDPKGPAIELNDADTPPYRGPVALYYGVPDELYVAVAQVRNQANLSQGIPQLEAAIAKWMPERADFYLELAEAYRHADDAGRATRYYEEARSRAPNDWRPYYGLGLAKGSQEMLQRADELAPRETAPLEAMAKLLAQQGKPHESVAALQRAVGVNPESGEIRNDLAVALYRLGDYDAAEKSAREAVRLRPEVAGIHVNLATILVHRDKPTEAQRHFEMARRLSPPH
jgi:Flp pilus assembly protein TadD